MDTDLHKIIISPQALSHDHVKLFFYQILRGVYYLHSAGIIHRDLKPGNLLVNSNCLVKICDFGLARVNEPCSALLTQEVITQYYRPPELLTGITQYSFSVDMWSVGCILFELLSRRILFQASSPNQQLSRIVDLLGYPASEREFSRLPAEVRSFLLARRQSRRSTESDQILESTSCRLTKLISVCKEATDLLLGLLRWNPEARLSAKVALESGFVTTGRARFHFTICECCQRQSHVLDRPLPGPNCCNSDSVPLEPAFRRPLASGFDSHITTVYHGKAKIWALIQEYFARDQRSIRVKINSQATNARSFFGPASSQRSGFTQPALAYQQ